MNDQDLQGWYAQILAKRDGGDRDRCMTPEQLEQLADGSAGADDRLRWMDHVATCPMCMREFAVTRSAAVAGSGLVRRRTRFTQLAIAAGIAAFAVGATVWRVGLFHETDIIRGTGSEVTLLSPPAELPVPPTGLHLVWASIPQVAHYEVEIVSAGGTPVFSAAVNDTVASIPPGVRLTPGNEYRWRVSALLSDGRRLQSIAQPLRVQNP